MSGYLERKDWQGRRRDNEPAECCGHAKGQHRGFPIADCIEPGCDCRAEVIVREFGDDRTPERDEEER